MSRHRRSYVISSDNYLTYANADLERQLCARELRNGQSEEGQCQASAIVAKGFTMVVPQFRRYRVRRDGEYQERNWDQKPARVYNDSRIRRREGDVCKSFIRKRVKVSQRSGGSHGSFARVRFTGSKLVLWRKLQTETGVKGWREIRLKSGDWRDASTKGIGWLLFVRTFEEANENPESQLGYNFHAVIRAGHQQNRQVTRREDGAVRH